MKYLPIKKLSYPNMNDIDTDETKKMKVYSIDHGDNLPSNDWYHVIQVNSTEPKYYTQFAWRLDAAATRLYIRSYLGNLWTSWWHVDFAN